MTGHTQQGLNNKEKSAAEKANAEIEAGEAAIAAGKSQLNAAIQKINSLPLPPSVKEQLIARATAQFNAQVAASGLPASEFPTSFPTLPAHGTLQFPQFAVLGYSFRPTPAWNIEADIEWTDWDSLNTFTLNRSGGSNVNVPFDWTNSFMYELGVTHEIGAYKLSAGYMYTENSVPAATCNPLIPDSARNVFSLGVGRSFGSFSVDLATNYRLGWHAR